MAGITRLVNLAKIIVHAVQRNRVMMIVDKSPLHSLGWFCPFSQTTAPARTAVRAVHRSGIMSVIAFHEKAGRSQGNSGFIVSS
jgi:hypothetical protein